MVDEEGNEVVDDEYESKYEAKCLELEKAQAKMADWKDKVRERITALVADKDAAMEMLSKKETEAQRLRRELDGAIRSKSALEAALEQSDKNQGQEAHEAERVRELEAELRTEKEKSKGAAAEMQAEVEKMRAELLARVRAAEDDSQLRRDECNRLTVALQESIAKSEELEAATEDAAATKDREDAEGTEEEEVEALRLRLKDREALTLRVKERAKEMIKGHKQTNVQLTLALRELRAEINDFAVDWDEMREEVKGMMMWPKLMGDKKATLEQMNELISDMDNKGSENLWLRGRTDALTQERNEALLSAADTRALTNELSTMKQMLSEAQQGVDSVTTENKTLRQDHNALKTESDNERSLAQELVAELRHDLEVAKEELERWQNTSAEISEREAELTVAQEQMGLASNKLVEVNVNMATMEYERSTLEQRVNELIEQVELEQERVGLLQEEVKQKSESNAEDRLVWQETVRALRVDLNGHRDRAMTAEKKLESAQNPAKRLQFERDELDMEGSAGQEKQLEVFVDSFTHFTSVMDLYTSLLHDDLSMRHAVRGTELEGAIEGGRSMSSETPSPALLDKARHVASSISKVVRQLQLLRKLLRKLSMEGGRWDWWQQMREHSRDVAVSCHSCSSHAMDIVRAWIGIDASSGHVSMADRISRLKSLRRRNKKGGYAKVTEGVEGMVAGGDMAGPIGLDDPNDTAPHLEAAREMMLEDDELSSGDDEELEALDAEITAEL